MGSAAPSGATADLRTLTAHLSRRASPTMVYVTRRNGREDYELGKVLNDCRCCAQVSSGSLWFHEEMLRIVQVMSGLESMI